MNKIIYIQPASLWEVELVMFQTPHPDALWAGIVGGLQATYDDYCPECSARDKSVRGGMPRTGWGSLRVEVCLHCGVVLVTPWDMGVDTFHPVDPGLSMVREALGIPLEDLFNEIKRVLRNEREALAPARTGGFLARLYEVARRVLGVLQ